MPAAVIVHHTGVGISRIAAEIDRPRWRTGFSTRSFGGAVRGALVPPSSSTHYQTPQARRKSATIASSMKETLKAVFENGVFRPLTRRKGLAERREVTLTVTVEEGPSPLADFAGRISSDDAQEMREVIEREFERVDPREWL